MKKKRKDFGMVFWMHLVLVLIYYLTPFLFSWKIVILIALFILLQYKFLGDCFLTNLEFQQEDKTFFEHYLNKIGISISKKNIDFIAKYIVPFVLPAIAIIWQVLLRHAPWAF
ncbi:MAG: hypothetical protein AABX07_00635 [Nanoarchaeota archaeon]